ncbi:Phosphotransferase enzyme family [Aspergillus sclerotialis]|uniref:Phosphotransferase enzyme family n=1 Tax=Aspergillus sclerotialis TaxID=2070753 RepID=A0A3A2ZZB8_9EURO|nr:Phosphotransferase enzyme family [Aspergillus sclerotialis]
MQVARAAGFPVPLVICYGGHPDTLHAPVSILMTRLPGKELGQAYETLSSEDKKSILQQFKGYMNVMRRWSNPWGGNRICPLLDTAIRSVRVLDHCAGPFESEEEFNEYLIRPSFGWYPDYWDFFTTALRFTREDFWWYNFVIGLGGGAYLAELDCERALNSLTSASYYW